MLSHSKQSPRVVKSGSGLQTGQPVGNIWVSPQGAIKWSDLPLKNSARNAVMITEISGLTLGLTKDNVVDYLDQSPLLAGCISGLFFGVLFFLFI